MTDARAFRGCRFPAEIILWAVRWYLQFGISYRDLERMLADRGVEVDHVTLYRSYDPFVSQAFIPSPHPPVRPVAASITRRPAAPRAAHSASWRTNDPLPAPGAHPAVVPADVRPHRLISGGGRASEPRCPIHGPSAGCPKGWDQAGYAAWRARHRRRSRIRSGARAAVLRRPLPRYGRRRITPRPPSARHPAAGCRCGCSAIGTPGASGRRRRSRSAAPGP